MIALNILLTGASGFIGRRLAAHLLVRGDAVSVLGRSPCGIAGASEILTPQLDSAAIAKTLAGRTFDAVLHLAAAGIKPGDRDAATLMQINGVLPGAMVAAAAQCGARAVVIAGSSAEYRAPDAAVPMTEDTPLCDDKLYGATKAAGALIALAQGGNLGVAVAVLRLFNVYGPGEAPHRLLPSLASQLLRGAGVPLSAGSQLRDFLHVDDACGAMLAALDALLAGRMRGGAYNVATGQAHSVADFARAAAAAVRADPALLQFGALPLRADDLPYVVGDPARLHAACGWTARYPMAAGVAAAIADYPLTGEPA